MSCISHASGKILPRVVNFYQEILYKSDFSNTSRPLLLKLPRNNQSFLIQLQVAEHQCISYRSFQTFYVCYYCLQSSSLSQSSSVFIFAGIKWKCYAVSVGRVMLLLSLERGIFVCHKISAVVKKNVYYKCTTAVIFIIFITFKSFFHLILFCFPS